MRASPALLALTTGVLIGCASEYETFAPPPIDYSDRAPLRLAVESVTVESAYRPLREPPYVDHLLPVSPEAATQALLEQRLQAAGGDNQLIAVILDASVEEEPLETTGGVRGYLTTESAARLVGRLKVRVEQLEPEPLATQSVTTAVVRSTSIPEGVGYAQRQRLIDELVRKLVDDLDAGLMANMRENFGELLQS